MMSSAFFEHLLHTVACWMSKAAHPMSGIPLLVQVSILQCHQLSHSAQRTAPSAAHQDTSARQVGSDTSV